MRDIAFQPAMLYAPVIHEERDDESEQHPPEIEDCHTVHTLRKVAFEDVLGVRYIQMSDLQSGEDR